MVSLMTKKNIRKSYLVAIIAGMLIAVTALTSSSTIYAQDNGLGVSDNTGLSDQPQSGTVKPAGAISAAIWHEFATDGPITTGCAPADPAGTPCTPSSGTATVFADAPPWTFTCVSNAGCLFKVTDAFNSVEQFDVFDNLALIGITSAPATFGFCGNDPEPCFADPLTSSGMFLLGQGPHSITITQIAGFATAAYFQFVEQPGGFFPITNCEIAGGSYDHWDKIIFMTDDALLKDSSGTFIKPRTVLEFKFPQVDPFTPINLPQLTADFLNSIGWTFGNGNPIQPNRLVIIDVEYTAVCVSPFGPG